MGFVCQETHVVPVYVASVKTSPLVRARHSLVPCGIFLSKNKSEEFEVQYFTA